MAKKKTHSRRAAGKTSTSISLSEDTLGKAKALAQKEQRSLSNWIELLITEKTKGINKLRDA
ncbi:MAG: hypothetical protein ACRC2U_18455 [Aeromonas sp.]